MLLGSEVDAGAESVKEDRSNAALSRSV